MKILHLIYTQGLGGAEKYLKHLLPGLKKHGIDCDLIVVCPKGAEDIFTSYCYTLNGLGVKTTLIVAGKLSVITTAIKINSYLRANKINVVHAHLFHADLLATVLKSVFFSKVYIISTKHGYQEKVFQQYDLINYKQPNDLYYYITKYMLRKIDKNIAVSKGMADLYYNLKLTKTRYPFIHHGTQIDAFDEEDYRATCRKGNPQLIIVGRIETIKGHHFLVDALPFVMEKFPDVKLLVLGEGSEKDNCIKRINKAGLQNNVEFLGFMPDPYPYISHSDVIISPSFFESFGLVYIEAFALKTAVVAFDTPAGNEIMVNNETAFLVEKGNSRLLAEKIIYLLKNTEERSIMVEKAYENYLKNFTTEVMIKKTADLYKGLVFN